MKKIILFITFITLITSILPISASAAVKKSAPVKKVVAPVKAKPAPVKAKVKYTVPNPNPKTEKTGTLNNKPVSIGTDNKYYKLDNNKWSQVSKTNLPKIDWKKIKGDMTEIPYTARLFSTLLWDPVPEATKYSIYYKEKLNNTDSYPYAVANISCENNGSPCNYTITYLNESIRGGYSAKIEAYANDGKKVGEYYLDKLNTGLMK